jgi:large subunit ribosomal protein L29
MKNLFRGMSKSQLHDSLLENYDSLQNLQFQQSLQQLEDTSQILKTKKNIARIKTIIRINSFNIDKSNQDKNK